MLRHPEVGSSYEAAHYLDLLATQLGRQPIIISGGDGIGEHPSQALLDLFTIIDYKRSLKGQHITMVGDLRFGRTVHSLSKLMGRYAGSDVYLHFVSPHQQRMPDSVLNDLRAHGVHFDETENLDDVIGDSDVIYWTRIQEERFEDKAAYAEIASRFVMTPDVLARASADSILMHPLPRKHEMGTADDHDVLDADPRAAYFRQMENGMFMRMALLALTLGAKDI